MIISASRRTDIPAFYSKWFMRRIREEFCLVPNPLNLHHLSRISLQKKDVEAIIFWSKNPAPMLQYLDELDECGYNYYFQYTLNAYPRFFEPSVPPLERRIETFHHLSKRIGPQRVVWRYDPILISSVTDYQFHKEQFESLAEQLEGYTHRVMISIVDFYKKTERRLTKMEKEEGIQVQRSILSSPGIANLMRNIADISSRHKITVFSCAEEIDFSDLGVPHGKCIDDQLINKMGNMNIRYKKDPSQRKACLCNLSKDIGVNHTCMHGCVYCYATTNYSIAQKRFGEHDSNSPVLWTTQNYTERIDKKNDMQMRLFPE